MRIHQAGFAAAFVSADSFFGFLLKSYLIPGLGWVPQQRGVRWDEPSGLGRAFCCVPYVCSLSSTRNHPAGMSIVFIQIRSVGHAFFTTACCSPNQNNLPNYYSQQSDTMASSLLRAPQAQTVLFCLNVSIGTALRKVILHCAYPQKSLCAACYTVEASSHVHYTSTCVIYHHPAQQWSCYCHLPSGCWVSCVHQP